MKKLFTTLMLTAVASFAFKATAQFVTITPANQIPAAGDSVHYVDANSFGFDPIGTGPVTAKVWDNSLLFNSGTFYDYNWVLPASVPTALGRDSFPTATIARGESGATGYFFYQPTANNIDRVGWFGSTSNFGIYEDNTVATEYHFPITAGNTVSSSYYGRFAPFNVGEDSVNIETGTLTINADMQGTMILPTGTFTNVLRLHVVELFHIKTYLFGLAIQDDIVQDDYYYWFNDSIFQPILVSGVTTINGSPQTPVLRYQPISSSTGINTEGIVATPTIYPNPSKGIFTIKNADNHLTNSSIEIYNVVGEKIYSVRNSTPQSTYSIDISSFAKGLYYVRIADGSNIHTEKIVIE
jgi:Secretion system C-terminal sorting domain